MVERERGRERGRGGWWKGRSTRRDELRLIEQLKARATGWIDILIDNR